MSFSAPSRPAFLWEPLRMDELARPLHIATPSHVFVDPMSDVFSPDLPTLALDHVFCVMAYAIHHKFHISVWDKQRVERYRDDFQRRSRQEGVGISIPDCVADRISGGRWWPALIWPLPNVFFSVRIDVPATV